MTKQSDHPSVRRFREKDPMAGPPPMLDAHELRTLCIDLGADDAGFVEIDRPELAGERDEILEFFPNTKSLISVVVKMNREPIHNPARSVANVEFHSAGERVDHVAHDIVAALEAKGIRAINPAMGFPMEMARVGLRRPWVVSHKTVAVAAGMGHMGIHRNVIHPKFGNFILLGTVLLDTGISAYQQPLVDNPCLECKLCVSACPVGAIGPNGEFSLAACFTHNYREFYGGFNDWIEQIADSKSAMDYRRRVSNEESASWWQSLSFGPNYKSAYCMAVCPAGDDVLSPFLTNRGKYLEEIVRPLQDKEENVYVIRNSDAEDHVARRFPHKQIRHVGNSLNRLGSIRAFLDGLPHAFQSGRSKGIDATYHFTFTGKGEPRATIIIRNQKLEIQEGHIGGADIAITADAPTWLGFLAKERNLIWALLRRKIRIKGSPRLLLAFGRCFPS